VGLSSLSFDGQGMADYIFQPIKSWVREVVKKLQKNCIIGLNLVEGKFGGCQGILRISWYFNMY